VDWNVPRLHSRIVETLTGPRGTNPTEERVDLDRLRCQDGSAFAELVAEHQAIVLGLGQSLGLRGPDLDDAAAEAFAAVYRALPRFEARSELGTWVYRIAHRVIVKAREKRKRQQVPELQSDSLASHEPGPGEDAEKLETARAIWDSVSRLEPRQASAVELYYRRQMPLEQIAGILECPLGTVKTLLFRAREQLGETLKKQEVYP
jgi:RNA polymerase sigma-70 factor (ECF subfamily)